MKKISLLIVVLVGVLTAQANFSQLQYEKIVLGTRLGIPSTWNKWTDNTTPSGTMSTYFKKGDSYKIGTFGSSAFALSNSSNTEKQRADVGLVTPAIKIPGALTVLTFNAISYNSANSNTLDVYVSDKGNAKEDFTDADLISTFTIPANTAGDPVECNVPLGKFVGKNVYIAFVNHSYDAGILGVNNFLFQEYYLEIDNTTPSFIDKENAQPVTLSVKIQTGSTCNGFTAKLTAADRDITSSYVETADLSELNTYDITLPETFDMKYGDVVNYSITLSPDFEGATPISINGSIACGKGYPGVCVEEEGTGEDCGYCPLGAAGLNKFSDDFGDQFIGIGVHCGPYSKGVMENVIYATPYIKMMTAMGGQGFPFAMINRKYPVTPYPDIAHLVREIISTPTVIGTKIDKVTYEPENDHAVTVDFSTELCVDMETSDYAAAAVLIADGLQATPLPDNATEEETTAYTNWIQNASGLKSLNEATVNSRYGSEWWPYIQPYAGKSMIIGMVYDHVGMGIWPTFSGDAEPIATSWKAFKPEKSSITFEMPMQTEANGFGVQDWKKTSVAVLILNKNTKEIVTGAKMKAADYTVISSGVKNADISSDYNITATKQSIKVAGEPGANVRVYTADGICVASAVMTESEINLENDNFNGLMIVSVFTGDHSYFKKMICK